MAKRHQPRAASNQPGGYQLNIGNGVSGNGRQLMKAWQLSGGLAAWLKMQWHAK